MSAMSKVVFELNRKGVGQLLKSPELVTGLKSMADEIAAKCGDYYESDSKILGTRVVSAVITGSEESYLDNLENNTLLRNLGA